MKQINTLKNKILMLIDRLAFFKEFNSTEKLLLIQGTGMIVLAEENEYVLQEGSKDTCLYIPLSGELAVRVKNNEGVEVTIAKLHPGDVIGEVTFITDRPRSASVVALRQTLLFRCSRVALQKLPPSAREKIKDQIIAKLIDRLYAKNVATANELQISKQLE